jgi:hypothetical protein
VLQSTAACALLTLATATPAPPGFALTAALNLTGTLAWFVRQTTELEVNMNSGGVGLAASLAGGGF